MDVSYIIMAIGLIIFVASLYGLLSGLGSRNWPSSTGTILSSGVSESYDEEEGTEYRPKVAYEYQAMGEKHIGERISYGLRSTGLASAYKVVEKYPQGSQVTVYYHPEKPNRSVLEPGANLGAIFGMVVGLGLVIYGLVRFFG